MNATGLYVIFSSAKPNAKLTWPGKTTPATVMTMYIDFRTQNDHCLYMSENESCSTCSEEWF